MASMKFRGEPKTINVVNAVAGIVLFASPWLFGFYGENRATWNAWVCGMVVTIFALTAVLDLQDWEEWSVLAAALWIAFSPWLLGFHGHHAAVWAHLVTGGATAVFAVRELWTLRSRSRFAA